MFPGFIADSQRVLASVRPDGVLDDQLCPVLLLLNLGPVVSADAAVVTIPLGRGRGAACEGYVQAEDIACSNGDDIFEAGEINPRFSCR